jgi:putative phage-type endonuclease
MRPKLYLRQTSVSKERMSPLLERVKQLKEATYADQRSEEWLQRREEMITASDAASAIGDNHYESIDSFVKKKVLKTKWGGNAATAHGTLLEPFVRDLYDQRFGKTTTEIGLVQHPDYPFIGGSADGITDDGILLEIKCPLTRKIEHKVPKYYMPQIQLLLEILDFEDCDFVQYRPAGPAGDPPEEFDVVRVKRDREWFKQKLPILQAVWDKVLKGREHGLCELAEDAKPYIKKSVACELGKDARVPPQIEDSQV